MQKFDFNVHPGCDKDNYFFMPAIDNLCNVAMKKKYSYTSKDDQFSAIFYFKLKPSTY